MVVELELGFINRINLIQKLREKKYTGEWIEPKLLTIYTVDEKGKKIKSGEVPLINDGTYGNYKQFPLYMTK